VIFNAFQREDADTVFTIMRNVSAVQISAGSVIAWDITASIDGVRVSTPATATLSACPGIMVDTTNDSAYGKVQIYGYNAGAYVTNNQTTAIAAGDILIPINALKALGWSKIGDGMSGFFLSGSAVATATAGAVTAALSKVILRCM
jgi:hypothetical protein